jgi:hypothetical protein
MGNLTEKNYHDRPGVPQITTNFTKPNQYKMSQRSFADNDTRWRECIRFATKTTERLVNFYRTTRCCPLEGSHLHSPPRESEIVYNKRCKVGDESLTFITQERQGHIANSFTRPYNSCQRNGRAP